MPVGTEVRIAGAMGGGKALVIGTARYSDDDRVVLLADGKAMGMPINVSWLHRTGRADVAKANKLRARYLASFPNTLKE